MSHPSLCSLYLAPTPTAVQIPSISYRSSSRIPTALGALARSKDYLDLVLLLEQYPKLHQTVNLVPSLILQIEDYIADTSIRPLLWR